MFQEFKGLFLKQTWTVLLAAFILTAGMDMICHFVFSEKLHFNNTSLNQSKWLKLGYQSGTWYTSIRNYFTDHKNDM